MQPLWRAVWTHRSGEEPAGCQSGAGGGNWVKRVGGLKSTDWWSQNSHGVFTAQETIANPSVITMSGASWVLEISGDRFVNYTTFQPLWCTPEVMKHNAEWKL